MSTIAYRAALVREIENSMKRLADSIPDNAGLSPTAQRTIDLYRDGKLDAYAHVLLLLKDEDL